MYIGNGKPPSLEGGAAKGGGGCCGKRIQPPALRATEINFHYNLQKPMTFGWCLRLVEASPGHS